MTIHTQAKHHQKPREDDNAKSVCTEYCLLYPSSLHNKSMFHKIHKNCDATLCTCSAVFVITCTKTKSGKFLSAQPRTSVFAADLCQNNTAIYSVHALVLKVISFSNCSQLQLLAVTTCA